MRPFAALRMTLLVLFCVFASLPARAVEVEGTAFAAIPVLHEGRVKPMESFAQAMHWRLTGSKTPQGQSAEQWLAEVIFDPLRAAERRQFTVRNPALAEMLALPDRTPPRYNFIELSAGLAPHRELIGTLAQQEELDGTQEQLLELQSLVIDYTQLMRSLSLLLPLSVGWDEADEAQDYLTLRKFEEQAQTELKAIIARKGEDIATYDDAERQVAAFSFQLQVIRDAAAGNSLFRVIPPSWNDAEWLAPWAVIESGAGSPVTAALLGYWQDMVNAWIGDDRAAFARAAAAVQKEGAAEADAARLRAEQIYNALSPMDVAALLYVLAAVLALAALRWPRLMIGALAVGAAAVLLHSAGMALRVYVLARPPVGTLYESVLFVSVICAATALMAARKQNAVLATGLAAAAGLLALAPTIVQSGDTMPVLVAVLNTNFWLATHVLVITAGYGFALLCGLAGHVWLGAQALGRPHSVMFAHRLGLLALLFTTVGTILGGIWADQSWGRFWGWDPKENGALLIVLWLVWALHGRRAGLMKPALYAATLAAVNIIVALAWFGVNLLSVGLHSYGFTSGVATALVAFCALEMVLIAVLYCAAQKRERAHGA